MTSLQIYHQVKFHQIIMMKKRGYTLTDVESNMVSSTIENSVSIFDTYFVKEAQRRGVIIERLLDAVYVKNGISVGVIFVENNPGDKQIKKDITEPLSARIQLSPIRHFIFISSIKWTSDSYKEFAGYTIYDFEFFLYRELIYDPTTHIFQPQFRILNEQQKQNLIRQLGNQGTIVLKRMCVDDPIAKFLGAKIGDIFKIGRDNAHMSQALTNLDYRIVDNTLMFEDKKPKEKVVGT